MADEHVSSAPSFIVDTPEARVRDNAGFIWRTMEVNMGDVEKAARALEGFNLPGLPFVCIEDAPREALLCLQPVFSLN